MKYDSLFDEFLHPGSNDDVFLEKYEQKYHWEKEYIESQKKTKETILSLNKDN